MLFSCQIIDLFSIPAIVGCCLGVFKRSWHDWEWHESMFQVLMYVMDCMYNCMNYYTCLLMIDEESGSEWEILVLCWVHDELQSEWGCSLLYIVVWLFIIRVGMYSLIYYHCIVICQASYVDVLRKRHVCKFRVETSDLSKSHSGGLELRVGA